MEVIVKVADFRLEVNDQIITISGRLTSGEATELQTCLSFINAVIRDSRLIEDLNSTKPGASSTSRTE